MSLPKNQLEHLKNLLMSLHNRTVENFFKGLPNTEETPIEDWAKIDIPETSLKTACWIIKKDSALIIILRLILFYVVVKPMPIEDLIGIIMSLDKNAGIKRTGHPKVTLFFANRPSTTPIVSTSGGGETVGQDKIIWRQVSFRIMDQTSANFSKQEAITLANAIKAKFGNNYKWKSGKDMYSYTEWDRGYQFQILGFDKTDIQTLIKDVMGLRGHIPNWTYLNINTNEVPSETYPATSHTTTILGDSFKEPVRRPIANVYFEFAMIHSPPHTPVCLYSRAGNQPDALIH